MILSFKKQPVIRTVFSIALRKLHHFAKIMSPKDFQKYHLYQSTLAELKPFRKQKQGNKSQQMQKRTNAC